MPAVPRTLGRPSFEHRLELGQVGVPSNEIVHAARWAKIDIHAQLRASYRRNRDLQVIDLERIRHDNSAAKIIFVWTRWSHGLAVMSHPMAPSGEAPESRPVRGKDLIESSALDSFITNGGQEASSNCAGVLPFLRRLQQLLAMQNLLQNCLMSLFGVIIGEANLGEVAAKVSEVIPGVLRCMLLSVLINGFECVE